DGRSLRDAQIEAITTLIKRCYLDENITMPARIHHILFEKKFDDISTQHRATTDNVIVTDVERRGAFVSEINTILFKKSEKRNAD
ncbi:unnamed protein product, partial [Adineta steineri]